MNKKPVLSEYELQIHKFGRWSTVMAILLLLTIPLLFCVIYDVFPDKTAFLTGHLKLSQCFMRLELSKLLTMCQC